MKYWETKIVGDWLYIKCPVMEGNLSFTIKRKLVEELRGIEKRIKLLRGWMGYTRLVHSHIMIMFLKSGAYPYKIEEGKIWFCKEIL